MAWILGLCFNRILEWYEINTLQRDGMRKNHNPTTRTAVQFNTNHSPVCIPYWLCSVCRKVYIFTEYLKYSQTKNYTAFGHFSLTIWRCMLSHLQRCQDPVIMQMRENYNRNWWAMNACSYATKFLIIYLGFTQNIRFSNRHWRPRLLFLGLLDDYTWCNVLLTYTGRKINVL